MPGTTSPDNIIYPLSSDPIAPLNAVFQDLAQSVQDALIPQAISSPTAGQKFVYDGTNWVNITGYLLVQRIVYTSNDLFNKSTYPWLRAMRVICQGGGGGAGGAAITGASQGSAGHGGDGGVYAESFITNISSLPSSVVVTVGAGGTGGNGTTGGAGGQSSFGSIVIADGGDAGTTQGAVAAPVFTQPPAISTGGSGDIVRGGGLSSGLIIGGTAASNQVRGGNGGTGIYGVPGGRGLNGGVNGDDAFASNYGAGGGGASNQASQAAARVGGAGAQGVVIVELYA